MRSSSDLAKGASALIQTRTHKDSFTFFGGGAVNCKISFSKLVLIFFGTEVLHCFAKVIYFDECSRTNQTSQVSSFLF